jgi:hypothetical protein
VGFTPRLYKDSHLGLYVSSETGSLQTVFRQHSPAVGSGGQTRLGSQWPGVRAVRNYGTVGRG